MNQKYFHFTLGPVQGFVAQARRTRDFWAGSFLLSWLSAVAMVSIRQQGGEIVFPQVDEDFLKWLQGSPVKTAPQQGCIPNRFKGSWAAVPNDFKPERVVESVNQAWQAVADAVWENDFNGVSWSSEEQRAKTLAIWTRQVTQFWELQWVLTDNDADSDCLDRRKNWRNYMPPSEPGVKCMMMSGWQELSGVESPHKNKDDLKKFWASLEAALKDNKNTLDLRSGEHLCAIAYIKRRFAWVFEHVCAIMPGGWTAHGWEVKPSVPSVSYLAAAPWLATVLKTAPEEAIKTFHDAAYELTKSYGEYHTWLDCVDEALCNRGDGRLFSKTSHLDGHVFFASTLDNRNLYADQTLAQRTKTALLALQKATGVGAPSPFYAVLLMDGDSLGKQLQQPGLAQIISGCLKAFTAGVAEIVERHSGFLVYAGGDDVLALLPVDFALPCAWDLRQHYAGCFAKHGEGKVHSTISAALVFAHFKSPLGKVLAAAHPLLDNVAKEGCGRDALAVEVYKPGGRHLQWAMPWAVAAADRKQLTLLTLLQQWQTEEQQTPFSQSWFFNIQQRIVPIAAGLKDEQLLQLLVAEYLNSGINRGREPAITPEQAASTIQPLMAQCIPQRRDAETGVCTRTKDGQFSLDAAFLLRFLLQKGVGDD